MIFNPKPTDYKDLLTVFRIGLTERLVDRAYVIGWADAIVKAATKPEEFFFELSLAKNKNRVIELIDAVPGIGLNTVTARALLGILYHNVSSKKTELKEDTALFDHLDTRRTLSEIEFSFIIQLTDEYDWNVPSVMPLDVSETNLLDFLSMYKEFEIDNYRSWGEINEKLTLEFKSLENKVKADYKAKDKAEKKETIKRRVNKLGVLLILLALLSVLIASPFIDGFHENTSLLGKLWIPIAWGLIFLGKLIYPLFQKAPRTKQLFRQRYLTKRLNLSDAVYAKLNQRILSQFQTVDLSAVKCIHLFLPIIENNEPNTWLIRDWLKSNHPEIMVVFPKTNFRTLAMKSYADDEQLRIETSRYGIPEPVAGNVVDVHEIDMVILPLLIFDKLGYRVGYGKGFYDRFCALCKPGTQFIGLSFFEPVDSIEDVNEYDVWMHACITPEQIWRWH